MGNFKHTKNEPTDGTQAEDPVGDGELIALVRKGDQAAFETLFRRHHAAANYVARTQSDNFSDAEDVVSEAFSSIFQSLAAGKGPDTFFRAYLLTTVRRIAYARNRAASRVQTTADDAVLDTHTFDEDPAIKEFEAMAMAQAFKSLPERWQAVLWHVDVEKMKPAAAAEIIGISPNGVSSLAIRAREGLRRAYLQNHVVASTGTDCEATSAQLGAFARGGLKRSSNQRIQDHLATCAKCTRVLAELDDVQSRMRIVLFPLMTGIPFTPGANALLTSATTEPALRRIRRIEVRKIFGGAVVVLGLAAAVALVSAIAQGVTGQKADENISAVSTPPPATAATFPPRLPAPAPAQPLPFEALQPTELVDTPSEERPAPSSGSLTPSRPVPVHVEFPFPTLWPPPTSALPVRPSPLPTLPLPTLPPPDVPTPTPEVQQEVPSNTVSADFSFDPGMSVDVKVLRIDFDLHGDAVSTDAYAIFSLPHGIRVVTDGSVYPPGWECQPVLDDSRLECVTTSVDRDSLHFALHIVVDDVTVPRTLDYELGGERIVSGTFSSAFG